MTNNKKMVIGITGASGSLYAKLLFDWISGHPEQVNDIALIMTDTAKKVWEFEIGKATYKNIPWKNYAVNDFYAPFASGSSDYGIMIIIPCSMGTMGRIANGTSDDLMIRAADVMLKEKRKLIIVPRETPYNLIHIRNMETLINAGALICPATPSFYSKPESVEDLANTVIYRVLQLAGFSTEGFQWGNDETIRLV